MSSWTCLLKGAGMEMESPEADSPGPGEPPTGRPWRMLRWLVLLLGLVCLAVGVVHVFNPFASLAVLVLLITIGLSSRESVT
jgi:hypothetical protein